MKSKKYKLVSYNLSNRYANPVFTWGLARFHKTLYKVKLTFYKLKLTKLTNVWEWRTSTLSYVARVLVIVE